MQKTLLALVIAGSALISPSAQAQSISDSDFLWVEPLVTVIPDGTRDTTFKVAIMIRTSTELGAMSIPITFAGHPHLRIDTTVITQGSIKGVTYGPAGGSSNWVLRTSYIDNDQQNIGLGFVHIQDGVEPMNDTLCYLHFILDGSGHAASVDIDSIVIEGSPLGAEGIRFTDQGATDHIPTWTPGVISIFATGDVDCDGEIKLTDIIYMVNFMFRQGPAPNSGCQ